MAAVDFFLKIDGIEGESQDSKHKGEIEILSWSWGASQAGTASYGGGSGAGKVKMEDFSFFKRIDKSSPKLMLACATGQHIQGKGVTLVCRKAGKEQQEYLKVTFSDVLVSSYETSGSDKEAIPLDAIKLNFSKVEFEYKEQKGDGTLGGTVKAGYDVKGNKAV
ncbi:MAG: type VI secretion system tube protein Hcp [Bryobacteraceae bacterium]